MRSAVSGDKQWLHERKNYFKQRKSTASLWFFKRDGKTVPVLACLKCLHSFEQEPLALRV